MKAMISDEWLEKGSGRVWVTKMELGPGNYPVYCDECHGLITLDRPGWRLSWLNGKYLAKVHENCAVFDQEVLL